MAGATLRNRNRGDLLCDVRSRPSRSTKNRYRAKCFGCLTIAAAVIYGVADEALIRQRVPTLSFNLPNVPPASVTEELARQNIGARDGHMYTPRLMKKTGLRMESGAVRASLVHYNSIQEVRSFGSVLSEINEKC